MAKLLTTKGITYFIEEIFKLSKEYVYIVSPYLKIDKQFEERLFEAVDKGLKVTLIYGKDKRQIDLINKSLKNRIEILFYESLHAKFYMNENHVLITSMNLHSYSQANNREIGVQFSKSDNSDLQVIEDCYREFESIKIQSEKLSNIDHTKVFNFIPLKVISNQNNDASSKEEIKASYDYSEVLSMWFEYLPKKFPDVKFECNDRLIKAKNFPTAQIDFSNSYGFITIDFDFNKEYLKIIKDKERPHLENVFKKYRLFWNHPYQINICHAKGITFSNVNDEFKYCTEGFDLIYKELKRIFRF